MTDITIPNGEIRLAGSVYGPIGATNILFLHGISSCRDTWEETVKRLEDKYRVWTLDFRGHGHSNRATSYFHEDYVSDADAILGVIGQPTIIIGHSLGGTVAAALAQGPHPLITVVFLEDPPMYMGETSEWEKGVFSKLFPLIRDKEIELQSERANLSKFIDFCANTPDPMGGTAAEHMSQRHLVSRASALQRHDPTTWEPVIGLTMFTSFDPQLPLKVPAKIIQADAALGPSLLPGHEKRCIATNPEAEIVLYMGAPHRIHATHEFESKFIDDVERFIKQHIKL